ncbi:helix-turn-helix domain-containing protein [Streptococcus salivarius]|uniref:helix-turn-helix domain-containing protein n=1 Tax=Streptococcus salivarius TaxID=1304 RepID=UPI00321BAE77
MNTQDNTSLDAESKETDNLVTLKDLYEAKGFKIKELGEAVGVSHRTIRRWNKDIAHVPFKNVVSLAKVLEMSLDELAGLLLSNKQGESVE